MADNCENTQRPEEVAENFVKTGSGIAETIVNAANEFNTETVIPTLCIVIFCFRTGIIRNSFCMVS